MVKWSNLEGLHHFRFRPRDLLQGRHFHLGGLTFSAAGQAHLKVSTTYCPCEAEALSARGYSHKKNAKLKRTRQISSLLGVIHIERQGLPCKCRI